VASVASMYRLCPQQQLSSGVACDTTSVAAFALRT